MEKSRHLRVVLLLGLLLYPITAWSLLLNTSLLRQQHYFFSRQGLRYHHQSAHHWRHHLQRCLPPLRLSVGHHRSHEAAPGHALHLHDHPLLHLHHPVLLLLCCPLCQWGGPENHYSQGNKNKIHECSSIKHHLMSNPSQLRRNWGSEHYLDNVSSSEFILDINWIDS